MEKNYKISVNFSDYSFEIESTDLKWLELKEKEYLQKFSEQPSRTFRESKKPKDKDQPEVIPPKITLHEFYRNYVRTIRSRPVIGVFMIYYLQKIKKVDDIKTTDVQQCFKEVAYPNWNKLNMTDILSNAKRRALLNYVNKQWTLTATGEDYVLNSISGKD